MKQKIMSGNQLMHQFIDTTVCVDCIFTALHEMQMRSSNENSVCLSLSLSLSVVVKLSLLFVYMCLCLRYSF